MSTEYPLFVECDDHSVRLVNHAGDLNWFEQIDVENGEFHCWDRSGWAQELTWHGAVCVEAIAREREALVLVNTLRKWAESESIVIVDGEEDPLVLWQRINAALTARWEKVASPGSSSEEPDRSQDRSQAGEHRITQHRSKLAQAVATGHSPRPVAP